MAASCFARTARGLQCTRRMVTVVNIENEQWIPICQKHMELLDRDGSMLVVRDEGSTEFVEVYADDEGWFRLREVD